MQCLNSGFNELKVDDLTSVKMLKVQKLWKFSLNHSNIITKYWVSFVLVYYNKWKEQFVNTDFNVLKVNGSTLIIEKMWRKSLINSNINVGFLIGTTVLINYGKCKMTLLSNGFNMLKFDSSTHVPCW